MLFLLVCIAFIAQSANAQDQPKAVELEAVLGSEKELGPTQIRLICDIALQQGLDEVAWFKDGEVISSGQADLQVLEFDAAEGTQGMYHCRARNSSTQANWQTSGPVHVKLLYRPSMCYQLPVAGPCQSSISAWYYNYVSGQCLEFIYTGCFGNSNRFATFEECTDSCAAIEPRPVRRRPQLVTTTTTTALPTTTTTYIPDFCNVSPQYGDCKDQMPQWYFNTNFRKCFRFQYSGCGGNPNKFATQDECQRVCVNGLGPL